MKITSCVPFAGQGAVARHGALVAVTNSRGPGPDPLLSAVAEIAEAGGDGSDLVIRAARAALGANRNAAWACAGVTADGGLAVLVHGHAAATVRVADAPEVTLTVSDSMLPVSRTFSGEAVTVILVIGGAAPPDERFWLGDGVVPGGGLALTAVAERSAPRVRRPEAREPEPRSPEAPQQDTRTPAAGWPGAGAQGMRTPIVGSPGVRPPVTGTPGIAPKAAEQADGWHPPTMDTPAVGTPEVRRTVSDPEVRETLSDPPQASEQDAARGDGVLVDGVLCANGHFNDPGAWSCRQCGAGLEQPPRHVERRPRPPLGELVFDDGTRATLDSDYVLGREPALDGDVLAGRARPLRINDPNGTVSRLHLKVSLIGWQVEVSDLGSANGSVLESPDGERTLNPFEPATIVPGARISIGHRSMQYLAYQGA